MPIDPAAIDALVRAGGWTLFVTSVVFAAVGAVRGWWVPGWIYRRSEARGDKLDSGLSELTQAVRRIPDDIAWNSRDRHDDARRGQRGG